MTANVLPGSWPATRKGRPSSDTAPPAAGTGRLARAARAVCGLALGLVLLGQDVVQAASTTIYSEAPPYAGLGDFPPAFPDIGLNSWAASNFVTNATTNGSYQLNVRLGIGSSGGSSATFFTALYGNVGPGGTTHYSGTGLNTPGALIATLSGDNDPDSPGIFSYDYSGLVTLAANTNYWVVVGTQSTNFNEYSPLFGRGVWPTAPVGARVEGMMFSQNQGGAWAPGPNWQTVHLDMVVSVDSVAAVPEPSAPVLALLGLGALAVIGRRRRI